jgi:prepilin-type processing-associated H-X9-DG protein
MIAGARQTMKPMERPVASKERNHCAFTGTDLLAILVILAIVSVLLVPALARTHVNSQGTQCMDNLRQITAGWWMYANDSQGELFPNRGCLPPNPDWQVSPAWVAGNLQGGPIGFPYTGTDATNSDLLVDSRFSALAAYVRNPALYKCPVDQSTWSTIGSPGQRELPRVRSYSMSQAIGPQPNGQLVDGLHISGHWLSNGNAYAPGGYPWRVYAKVSDLVAPTPSQLFLLLDEHPNSIDDGAFAVQMPLNSMATYFVDVPAAYHDNGCNFSFADGHVEFHEWTMPQAIPAVVWAADMEPAIGNQLRAVPRDADVLWLAHRTTALAPGAPATIYQP